MRISHLIFIGFLFILMLFALVTYINTRQSEEVRQNSEVLSRSYSIVRESVRFQRNILNMVSGLRGYLLTGENYFVQTYDSAAVENGVILNELDSIVDKPSYKQTLATLKVLHAEWVEDFRQTLFAESQKPVVGDSSLEAFTKLYRQKALSADQNELYAEMNQEIRKLINEEYRSRDVMRAALEESAQKTKNISYLLTILSAIAGVVISMFVASKISSRIVKMVDMSHMIAAGNYKVSTEVKGNDELSELEQSLNNMNTVLANNFSLLNRKNEELDQYAHIVSHDLKTPLRGIGNVITWIEEDHGHELTPKVREYLGLIKGRQARAENMIHGLLTYARVGKENWEYEDVNVDELVREIIDSISVPADFTWEVQPGLPEIRTERLPLFQVFVNLISNAVKYNAKENGWVRIYFKEHELYYEFFVEDNGPGIDKAYQEKIFMLFHTLNSKDSFENTGVGLAIVKKVLEDRKEQIFVNSKPGNGSVFHFTWSKI